MHVLFLIYRYMMVQIMYRTPLFILCSFNGIFLLNCDLKFASLQGSSLANIKSQCIAALKEGSQHPVTRKLGSLKNISRGMHRFMRRLALLIALVFDVYLMFAAYVEFV